MSVDILLSIPDDAYIYEVVDGVLVRMAGSGDEATTIGGLLVIARSMLGRRHPTAIGHVLPTPYGPQTQV